MDPVNLAHWGHDVYVDATGAVDAASRYGSLLVATVAVAISFAQLWLSRRIFRAGNRAWVTMAGVEGSSLQAGVPPTVQVRYRNTGKTPAIKVVHRARVSLGPSVPNTSIDSPGYESVGFLAADDAKVRVEVTGPRALTDRDIRSIHDGSLLLVVDGVITYQDVFRASHVTRYAYLLQKDGWAIADAGNELD